MTAIPKTDLPVLVLLLAGSAMAFAGEHPAAIGACTLVASLVFEIAGALMTTKPARSFINTLRGVCLASGVGAIGTAAALWLWAHLT